MPNITQGNNVLDVQLVPIVANLYGKVTDAVTNNPIAGVKIMFDGRETYTDANGNYTTTNLTIGELAISFSHIDYLAYQIVITLSPGTNGLNMSLARAVVGQIVLLKGYNMVTYTGRSQTVNDAFASIAQYVARVYRFADGYYEDISRSPIGITTLMIPGDDYWVAVYQDSLWIF